MIFDHQVRNLSLARRGEKNAREYGKIVHNDYTAKSGPRRVRDHLPPAEADQLLQHRFAESANLDAFAQRRIRAAARIIEGGVCGKAGAAVFFRVVALE